MGAKLNSAIDGLIKALTVGGPTELKRAASEVWRAHHEETAAESAELKPCPFILCGHEAESVPEGDVWEVRCTECSCTVSAGSQEAAERLWNTRE